MKKHEEIIFGMLEDWRGYDNAIADFRFPFHSLATHAHHELLVPSLMGVLETYIMAERLRVCTPYIDAVKFGEMTVHDSENIIGLPVDLRQRVDLVAKYQGLPRMFLQLIVHARLVFMTEGAEFSPYLRHLAVLEKLEEPIIPVDDLC